MNPTAAHHEAETTDGSRPPLLADLSGRALPAISLPSTTGSQVDLPELDRAVLYFYPGAEWSPEAGYDSRALDDAQHRAFSDYWQELLALGCPAFGVSTEAATGQDLAASTLGIGQPLLCDADQAVGRELGLPTFGVDVHCWYCRLTLIVSEGSIVQVFYPVSALRSPAQAIAWMRRHRWT